MQTFNSAASMSGFPSNGTTRSDSTHTPWTYSLPTAARGDVNGVDRRLSGNLAFFQEFAKVMQRQCYTTVPTGCHSIPENSLPFYSKTADSEQFYYYPPETQDYIPSTTDDTLDVWSHANFPGLDLGEFPASFQAMISQPSTAQLPVMTSLQASSHSPGAYHVCEWIENNARCGQTISGVMRELSTHLRDAHHIQGNDKKMLVCFWRDCGRELQRGNMKRHVATRHLNVKSPCDYCLKSYSRRDAMKEHARECQGA